MDEEAGSGGCRSYSRSVLDPEVTCLNSELEVMGIQMAQDLITPWSSGIYQTDTGKEFGPLGWQEAGSKAGRFAGLRVK